MESSRLHARWEILTSKFSRVIDFVMVMMEYLETKFFSQSWNFLELSMWKKKNCLFSAKKSKSTNRSKIAFIIWWLSFNLNEVSLWSSHLISQSINIFNRPFKLKVAIWDIYMSENRCLEIRFRAFSFLLFWAIRQVRWQRFLTWKFLRSRKSHESQSHLADKNDDEISVMKISRVNDISKIAVSKMSWWWQIAPDEDASGNGLVR